MSNDTDPQTSAKAVNGHQKALEKMGESNTHIKDLLLKFTGIIGEKEELSKELEAVKRERNAAILKMLKSSRKCCNLCHQSIGISSDTDSEDSDFISDFDCCPRCEVVDSCWNCGEFFRCTYDASDLKQMKKNAIKSFNCLGGGRLSCWNCSDICIYCEEEGEPGLILDPSIVILEDEGQVDEDESEDDVQDEETYVANNRIACPPFVCDLCKKLDLSVL